MADQEVDSSATTQLHDTFPQINTALRVSPPSSFNTPNLANTTTADDIVRKTAFSPAAFTEQARNKGTAAALTVPMSYADQQQTQSARKEFSENHADYRNRVKDFTTLAFSMKRAGNTEAEAAAYFCLGVTLENMGKPTEAMSSYTKFLTISRSLNDAVGTSLAYNVMACNRITTAVPVERGSPMESNMKLGPEQTKLVKEALELHTMHLNVTDEGGQFVANTNIGVCHALLGDLVVAAHFHQDALRTAIRMQSFSGQSVAVGNLGLLAYRQNDMQTAQACLEQHLQLTQSLRCVKGESNAWLLLGSVSDAEGDYEKAIRYFEEGRRVAESNGMVGMLKRFNCLLGVVQGKNGLDAHLERLVKRATANAQL